MEKFISSKKPGNILSAFKANMNEILPDKYKKIKQDLVQRCGGGVEHLQASWTRLIEAFDDELKLIEEKGPEIIPQIEFSAILKNDGNFPSDFAEEVRKRGCVVIRNVVDRTEALKYKETVQQYINNHEGKIAGFPGNKLNNFCQFYETKLYIGHLIHRRKPAGLGNLLVKSKSNEKHLKSRNKTESLILQAQIAARSNPNFVAVTRALNTLWSAMPETPIDFDTSITYCDRLRIRLPGDSSFRLGEHMDGGSVERMFSFQSSFLFIQSLKPLCTRILKAFKGHNTEKLTSQQQIYI